MKKNLSTAAAAGSGIVAVTMLGAFVHADSLNYADLSSLETDLSQAAVVALNNHPGKIIEAELEMEHDQAIWEIEVVDENNQVTKLEIDGLTGDIRKTKASDDRTPNLDNITGFSEVASLVQAIENGEIVEMELEDEDGDLIWEIEVVDASNKRSEYRVNGLTGELL